MKTGENSRDYKHEYKIRKNRIRRLHADISRDKAEQFIKLLQGRGLTFSKWLTDKIDDEQKKAQS